MMLGNNWWDQEDDPSNPNRAVQNYGIPGAGQLQPQDSPSSANQGSPPQGYRPPMGPHMGAAPQPQTPSGRGMDPTVMQGGLASFNQGMANRGRTDMGKGGWQGPINLGHQLLNAGPSWASAPLGIGRRAHGSEQDYSVADANQILQRAYQAKLGRQASPQELQSQLQGQGLTQGDRWVGKKGLEAIIQSLSGGEVASASPMGGPAMTPQSAPSGGSSTVAQGGLAGASPMPAPQNMAPVQAALQGQGGMAQPAIVRNTPENNPQAMPNVGGNSPQTMADAGSAFANLIQGQVDFTGMGRGGAQVNPMAFKGFNDARALSGGDAQSAKDAFRDLIGQSGIDLRGLSKQEVGAKLEAEVVPLLQSKGYPARVKPGEYDIIEVFSNERGWEPIDVVENAGSAEAAWQWGDLPGQAPQGPFNPQMLQTAAAGASPEDMALAQSLGIDTTNPLWKQMFQQFYQQQGAPQVDPQFLSQLIGGQ